MLLMTAQLRARIYRRPNANITGLDQSEPQYISTGWAWQLWSGTQLVDWGIRGSQPDALTAACHHLRRLGQPGVYWTELGRWGTP